MKRTLFNQRCQRTNISVHLCQSLLGVFQVFFLHLILASLSLIVCSCDTGGIVTDNDLDILVLRFLLKVLELQFAEEGL